MLDAYISQETADVVTEFLTLSEAIDLKLPVSERVLRSKARPANIDPILRRLLNNEPITLSQHDTMIASILTYTTPLLLRNNPKLLFMLSPSLLRPIVRQVVSDLTIIELTELVIYALVNQDSDIASPNNRIIVKAILKRGLREHLRVDLSRFFHAAYTFKLDKLATQIGLLAAFIPTSWNILQALQEDPNLGEMLLNKHRHLRRDDLLLLASQLLKQGRIDLFTVLLDNPVLFTPGRRNIIKLVLEYPEILPLAKGSVYFPKEYYAQLRA